MTTPMTRATVWFREIDAYDAASLAELAVAPAAGWSWNNSFHDARYTAVAASRPLTVHDAVACSGEQYCGRFSPDGHDVLCTISRHRWHVEHVQEWTTGAEIAAHLIAKAPQEKRTAAQRIIQQARRAARSGD